MYAVVVGQQNAHIGCRKSIGMLSLTKTDYNKIFFCMDKFLYFLYLFRPSATTDTVQKLYLFK